MITARGVLIKSSVLIKAKTRRTRIMLFTMEVMDLRNLQVGVVNYFMRFEYTRASQKLSAHCSIAYSCFSLITIFLHASRTVSRDHDQLI